MDKKRMERYWRGLVDIGPRPSGSPMGEQAAQFLYNNLSHYLENVQTEAYTFQGWQSTGATRLEIDGQEVYTCPMLGCGSTGGEPISGEVIPCGYLIVWGMYQWKRYAIYDSANDDIWGHIVVRPEYPAIPQLMEEGLSPYPYFVVDAAAGEGIDKKTHNGCRVMAKGIIPAQHGCYTGRNITATLPGVSQRKIILTAHYDTMFNTCGAYDNASGVAALMELMHTLQEKKRQVTVELVLADSEEWNLAGSRYHAQQLDQQQVEFVLNIDGIGRGETLEFWSGGQEYERRLINAMRRIDTHGLSTEYKWPAPPGSDHVPYLLRNIPAQMITINDQPILHTPEDVCDQRMLENMYRVLPIVEDLLAAYQFIE